MTEEPIDWHSAEMQAWDAELEKKWLAGAYDDWPFGDGTDSKAHPSIESVVMGQGDCLAGMRDLPDACVDAVVTDPPYGISVDGKAWDAEVPGVPVWREVLRVAKPGALVIAASHAKTYHQLATILELSGFEVVDMLHWTYSQAFPAGAKLDDEGWRTLLRRAHEPWCVARKPLEVKRVPGKRAGTTKQRKMGLKDTFLEHGTGGLRVSGNGQDGAAWAANSFHVEKPREDERSLGLDPSVVRKGTVKDEKGLRGGVKDQANNHSTVKPLVLMRRLVNMVARPGQTVMDPFAGSGTTGMAAMAEGCNFIGFELDAESFELFKKRVAFAHGSPDSIPKQPKQPAKAKPKPRKRAQAKE